MSRLPGSGVDIQTDVSAVRMPVRNAERPADRAAGPRGHELDERFRQAVIMLHAREYDHAVTALHRVLELAPELPEAHVNMGFAMNGLKRFRVAHDFFQVAIALRPMQANAYYGLAMALEGLGDQAGAMGAMRSYIHLTSPDDRYLPKARAALWEWGEAAPGESHNLE